MGVFANIKEEVKDTLIHLMAIWLFTCLGRHTRVIKLLQSSVS